MSRRSDTPSLRSPLTGKPYPVCRACQKTAYADGLCYRHYQSRLEPESDDARQADADFGHAMGLDNGD